MMMKNLFLFVVLVLITMTSVGQVLLVSIEQITNGSPCPDGCV